MSAEELLVIFRTTSSHGQVYFADIPASGQLSNLSLHGPIELRSKKFSYQAGTPVFDYNRDQILWASVYQEREGSVWLWRLDPHFSPVSSQKIPIEVEYSALPFIILDGKVVTVAGGTAKSGDQSVVMSRRGQDNNWSDVPFKSSIDIAETFFQGTTLYKPSGNTPLKYIFAFRFDKMGQLYIDTIRESSFNELSRDNSIQWQHFKLDVGFGLRRSAYTPIVLHDKVTRKNRLYLFSFMENSGILYNFFPLRQDGSMDTYDSELSADKKDMQLLRMSADLPAAKRLKVHEAGGRLIILLETGKSNEPLVCYSGYIQKNGLAPGGDAWTKVSLEFDRLDTDGNGNATFSSVITPISYK